MPSFLIITAIFALLGASIVAILIFMVLYKHPKKLSSWFLAGWLLMIGIINQIVSVFVIFERDYLRAKTLYQRGMPVALFIPFFYLFIKYYLKPKSKKIVDILTYIYIFTVPIVNLIYPSIAIKDVVFSQEVSFYIPVYNHKTTAVLYLGFLPWLYAVKILFDEYKKSRSAVKRNRLKYIIVGSILPLFGFIAVSLPIYSIRKFPIDNFSITLGSIFLVYAVIRYQAFDISVIIRRSLVYSVLTTVITGVYLLLSFFIQMILGVSDTAVSISAALITALVIAVVFHPLQNITQSFIDKVFFRKSYDSKKLIAEFSQKMSSTIELDELGEAIVGIISKALQIDKYFLAIYGKNGKLNLLKDKGIEKQDKLLVDLTKIKNFNKSNTVFSYHDVHDKNVSFLSTKHKIELLVFLKTKDELIGILGLGPKLSQQAYSLDEYGLLGTLSNQAAIAIENAKLLEQARKQRRRAEKLLRKERELDLLKDEFVAIASHNLRTPLTIAKGNLSELMLKKQFNNDVVDHYIKPISDSLTKLSNLTEELITISTMKSKDYQLKKQEEDIISIVEYVYKKFKTEAKLKKLKYLLKLPKNKNIKAQVDKSKLITALENLVDNAFKFTDSGSVLISIDLFRNEVVVNVVDTGRGILHDDLKILFKKFHQVKKKYYEYTPGEGLGLYITKLIVEAHGGKVWAKSEKGKGSAFSISIPF